MTAINATSLSLPEFMAFDFDPVNGPQLKIKEPLSDEEILKERVKIVVTFVGIGAFAFGSTGLLVGGIKSILARVGMSLGTKAAIATGAKAAVGGAMIGGVFGWYRVYTSNLGLAIQTLSSPLRISDKLAREIIPAFVDEEIKRITHEFELAEQDVLCPITHRIMAYPVKTLCSHTFEYIDLVRFLNPNPRPTCPMCRAAVKIEDLTRDKEKERLIFRVAHAIFKKMEIILNALPSQLLNDEADFTDRETVMIRAQEVKAGLTFLQSSQQVLLAKVKNPHQLTSPEAYALAHYLVYQLTPLRLKIKEIQEEASARIHQCFFNNLMSSEVMTNQIVQLKEWYDEMNANLVPEKCPKMRALYFKM